MLLCRTGLYPAKQSESRAAKFCPVSLAHVIASAKFANAPATAQANIFCPLSPEAVLLTGKKYGLENFPPFFRRRRREGGPAKRRRGERSATGWIKGAAQSDNRYNHQPNKHTCDTGNHHVAELMIV